MSSLPELLDRLEEAGGPADPVPSADGWELVLAENIGYLIDDQRRWRATRRPSTEPRDGKLAQEVPRYAPGHPGCGIGRIRGRIPVRTRTRGGYPWKHR